jgi:hypothetical protein
MASSALAICSRNLSRDRQQRLFHPLAQIAGRKMLHGDVGVIVGDAEIVNSHDILVLQAGNDFIFLQEAIEAHDALGNVGHLIEHLEHDQRAGALALGEINGAHAAAADLPDAAMAADHHGPEAVALFEIGVRPLHRERLPVLARSGRDGLDEPLAIDLAAVKPVQPRSGGGLGRRRVLQHEQHDGRELGFGQQDGRQSLRGAGRRRSDDDDRIEADGRKLRVERAVLAQAVFHQSAVRPFDLNVLSDQQSMIVACSDHQ